MTVFYGSEDTLPERPPINILPLLANKPYMLCTPFIIMTATVPNERVHVFTYRWNCHMYGRLNNPCLEELNFYVLYIIQTHLNDLSTY